MPTPFIARLVQTLPADAHARVLAGLQGTPTLWDALQRDTDLAQKALSHLGAAPERWIPGNLTRLLLDLPLSPEAEAPPPLRQEAAQAYAAFRKQPRAPQTARTVALLALVLTEQRRLTGHWTKLAEVLGAPQGWSAWREPFAAAYSLAADRRAMAEAVLDTALWEGFLLLTHALLTLPLPAEVQQAHIGALVQRLELPLRMEALAFLAHRRPEIVHALHSLWEQAPLPPAYRAWVQGLLLLPSNPEAARRQFGSAWDLGRRFQAQVAAELGLLAQQQGDLITAQTAWAQANEISPDEPLYLARRILTALALGHLETAGHLLPEKPQHPALRLAAARFAAARQEPHALTWAQEALQAAEQTPLPTDMLVDLAQLFRDLNRPDLALEAAHLALREHPHRADIHDLATAAALESHNAAQAVEHAALALHLEPTPRRHRTYAQALTLGEHWAAALEAWQQALRHAPQPATADRLTLARVALKAGKPAEARAVVEALLQERPNEAQALALRGEILAAQGQPAEAEAHLREAIRRVPQAAALHLALAQVLQRQGKADEALEALRLAAQSLPQNAAVQAALGRALLQQERYAQALPPLQKAFALAGAKDPSLALDLGRALLHLRRVDEALSLLRETYQRQPALPGLNTLLGQAYLEAGQPEQAIPLLAQALQQEPPTPELALHYARAVLAAGESPTPVVHLLQQHQAWFEAPQVSPALRAGLRLALAEALETLGDGEQALEMYHQAYEESPTLAERLRAAKGLARTALRTGQPSLAAAVLEDLRESHPEDAEMLHLLAQAYAASGLPEKALDAAATPFQTRSPTPEEALAFTDLARRLNAPPRAVPILERARTAYPTDPRLPLTLAQVYLENGQQALAADVLRAMLRTEYRPPLAPALLAQVGEALLEAGEPEQAAQTLSQALEAHPNAPAHWWLGLVKAIQQQGAHALALEKAQDALQAITGHQETPPEALAELHLLRAESFLALGETGEARQALDAAGEAAATAEQWHRLSQGYTKIGHYPAALTALEHALSLEERPQWVWEAADLALGLLQITKSRRLLESLEPEALAQELRPVRRRLLAALALTTEEETQALAAWKAEEQEHPAPQDALYWALEARLAAQEQDQPTARQALQRALERLAETPPAAAQAAAWEETALAALDVWAHDVAVETLRTLSNALPQRPRSALLLARAVVQRAERKGLLLKAEAIPEGHAVAGEAERRLWESALQRAAQGLGLEGSAPEDWVGHPLLGRWALRGLALWSAEVRPGDLLEGHPTPSDVAASLLLAWRQGRRLPRLPKTLPHLRHPEVQATLALLSDRPSQALPHAQQAAAEAPGNAIFHALFGRLALEQGAFSQALQAYQAALTLMPGNPRWHARAAQAAERLGEPGLHLRHLEEAARLEPAALPRALALAQAYLRHGQSERALDVLHQAETIHDGHPDLLLAFATLHRALGHREEALARLKEAHARAPERSDITLTLAEHHLEAGHVAQAAVLLETLPPSEAQRPQAVLLRARLAEAQGDVQAALRLLKQAAAQADEPLPLLIAHAEMLRRAKGPQAAVEAWQALTEIRPDLPLLWAHLAEALAEAGQPQPARQAAQKALRGAEALAPEQQARLYLLLGRLARQQGHLDQAVDHLTKAIALRPTVEAYLELGRAEADRRRPEHALEAYQRAMGLAPNDARPYYQAGVLYRDLHDYPQAERYLRRAAQLAPKDVSIRRALAAVASINLLHPINTNEG